MYIDFVGVKPEMFISGLGGLIFMTPTGYGTPPLPSLNIAIWRVLKQHYKGIPIPATPINKLISVNHGLR
jgi:hypothetical protein